jgi:hypothetical protein
VWVVRAWTNDDGHTVESVMTQEIAARSDEQIRAMHRHLEPLAQRSPDPAMDPINRVLNANLDAFVLERLEASTPSAETSASTTSSRDSCARTRPAVDRDDGPPVRPGDRRTRRPHPQGPGGMTRPRGAGRCDRPSGQSGVSGHAEESTRPPFSSKQNWKGESVAPELNDAIEGLLDRRSPRRRSAARILRRLGDPAAGPALLTALERELRDVRTWETQYQLVMALGMCGHCPALDLLYETARRPLEATMVHLAVGDAIVRLAQEVAGDPKPVRWCVEQGNTMLADGALRAVAMLRQVPDDTTVDYILDAVARGACDDFWVVAAAAGWTGERTRAFLEMRIDGPLAEMAVDSLRGKYRNHRPL